MRKIIQWLIIFGLVFFGIYFSISFEKKFFLKPSTRSAIGSLPYYIDTSGWDLVLSGNTDGESSMSFKKMDSDTIKHVIFSVDDHKNVVGVIRYTKIFPDGDKKYTVKMDSKDTLYSYFIENLRDTIFSIGEYYFRFTNLKLDTAEREYYLLYKDSLKQLRGDNLPKLPSLSKRGIIPMSPEASSSERLK